MLDYARDCLAGRNLSGLLTVCTDLRHDQILDLLESALRSKKEWAWPHLVRLVEHPTSVLCVASVHRHTQCFDTVFNTLDWTVVSTEIAHDLITRCATHNDTHGFFKVAAFVPVHTCSNIAPIAVRRNNPEILAHILSGAVLTSEEQRQSVVRAVEMQHETCLDILLPYITTVSFVDTDIQHMMHHVGAPADLFKKIAPHLTKQNFNTILHLACEERNDHVVDWAFRFADPLKVLKKLDGDAFEMLQQRINQAQHDRLRRHVSKTKGLQSTRKM